MAINKDKATTWAGLVSAAFQAAAIFFPPLAPVFQAGAALGLAVLGYFTNKE